MVIIQSRPIAIGLNKLCWGPDLQLKAHGMKHYDAVALYPALILTAEQILRGVAQSEWTWISASKRVIV